MVWERDPNVPYPSVWREFQVKSKNTNEILKFQIQDATEDMFDVICDLMLKYFLPQEPIAKCFDIVNDAESIPYIKGFYLGLIQARTVLVCVKIDDDNRKTVVGCNLTMVAEPSMDFSAVAKTKNITNYLSIFTHLSKEFNIFEHFKVNHCLKAAGLAVHEDYRGMGIATEILNARTELCKALKIPLTATEFTSAGGQASARKAGFTLILEKKYADLMKEIPGLPLENISHPMTQLMYKKIDL